MLPVPQNDKDALEQLFADAQEGGLSANSVGMMVHNLNATTMAGAMGTSADDLAGDEVTLFLEILDKTGSMEYLLLPVRDVPAKKVVETAAIVGMTITEADVEIDDMGNNSALRKKISRMLVIHCYNEQIEALLKSKASDSVLMSTWLFDTETTLRHSYMPLADVPRLDWDSYDPDGMTAIYDSVIDGVTSVVAYAQSLINSGIRVKVVVVLITDDDDNASTKATASKVKSLVEDLLGQEFYTFAMVCLGKGAKAGASMGFPSILNETSDASGIRRALGTVSASVIKASQTQIGTQNPGGFFN